MNKHCNSTGDNAADPEGQLVWRVMLLSGLLLVVLTTGSWYLSGWFFARSVLIGGFLVNSSFWLLKTDIQRLMQRVGGGDGNQGATYSLEKTRFFLRFYARLVVLGLLLVVMASQVMINVIGLALGLSTVMFSVVIIGLSTGRCSKSSKA